MKNKVSLIVSFSVLALQASNMCAHPGHRNHDHPTRQQFKHDTFLTPHANAVSSLIDQLFAYEEQPLLAKLEIKEIKAPAMRSTILHYYNLIAAGNMKWGAANITATYFLPEYLAQNVAKNARKLLEHITQNMRNPRYNQTYIAQQFEMEIKTMALDAMSSNTYGCLAPFVGAELEFLCNSYLANL